MRSIPWRWKIAWKLKNIWGVAERDGNTSWSCARVRQSMSHREGCLCNFESFLCVQLWRPSVKVNFFLLKSANFHEIPVKFLLNLCARRLPSNLRSDWDWKNSWKAVGCGCICYFSVSSVCFGRRGHYFCLSDKRKICWANCVYFQPQFSTHQSEEKLYLGAAKSKVKNMKLEPCDADISGSSDNSQNSSDIVVRQDISVSFIRFLFPLLLFLMLHKEFMTLHFSLWSTYKWVDNYSFPCIKNSSTVFLKFFPENRKANCCLTREIFQRKNPTWSTVMVHSSIWCGRWWRCKKKRPKWRHNKRKLTFQPWLNLAG